MADAPPIVALIAPSGTGKTTLLEQLIPALVRRGVAVAAVKHDAHAFQVDRPGKDTHRLRAAGATRVAIANDRELAVYGDVDADRSLRSLAARYLGTADLVLAEGWRGAEGIPKLVVARRGAPKPPYDPDADDVLGVVADHPLETAKPTLALDDVDGLASFLIDALLTG